MNKITVNGYERITIKKALKIYLTGEPVYIVPSKVRIGSGWFEYPFPCCAHGVRNSLLTIQA